ncbi:hypothetical protein GALMADRAFT_219401 [Galerina marginata CBS 339.88]|uniref:Ubiquitin-like domain-containing protein n=1 Tax=Galerina marginata (strain CBS 339.88) TaxID=685588 RepID=A0A067TK36_GALM3|nr:hypothetical protein GALMADRAFT_219401 [Galerina marginata CBS 339.88]
MSLVDIHVDLPSYSRSFVVRVLPSSSVAVLKQEIHRTCPGQPRPEGQRLIWRGRVLADDENIENLWKAEPRIVHLAVHPSAWSSLPPEIPQSLPQVQPLPLPTPTFPTYTSAPSMRWGSNNTMRMEFTTPPSRPPMAFVLYLHQKALSCLSSTMPPPDALDNTPAARSLAFQTLERNGWTWPAILDGEFPPSTKGGVEYNLTIIDGQSFLQLSNSEQSPTPIQEHALKVLSYTFSILSMSLQATPTVRAVQSQSTPIPRHVNQLLQQLGMPPLRVANNAGPVIPNQNNPGLPQIREIPIRPLLAPLVMLILRTMLLLYFVAPTRKPVFGILILAWMLYEIWRPIRNGMRNGWGRIPQNQNQQRGNDGQNARPGVNAGQPNVVPAPAANAPPIQPGPVGPVTLDLQASQLFDAMANMNIEEEERMLNPAPDTHVDEPSLGHKTATFLGLFATTLHPAIWNRRRVALRRREGVVRTEANARNAPPDGDSEPTAEQNVVSQRREELRAQFARRPRWIQRYMERVVAEDWVDDSD